MVVMPALRAERPKSTTAWSVPSARKSAWKEAPASDMAAGSLELADGVAVGALDDAVDQGVGVDALGGHQGLLTVARCRLAWMTRTGRVVETRSRWLATRRSPAK